MSLLPSRPSAFMFLLPSLPSAFMSLPPSRPSAFMSLPPLARSLSELMLFDFCMSLSSARWFLPAPGDFSSDCVAFMPDDGLVDSAPPRFAGAAEFPRSGALCWAEPAGDRSRSDPVPCAFAKPAPAISATAATDTIKRLVIEYLLACLHCPRQQRQEMGDVPRYRRFRGVCFVNAR